MRLRKLSVIAAIVGTVVLQTAFSAVYEMPAPGNDIIGQVQYTHAQHGEDLDAVGARYGVGMHEMMEANPNLPSKGTLRSGQKVMVPTQYVLPPYRKGIVVNIPELRLYYFTPDGKYVMTYPVGLGRDQWRTPLASTTVVKKATNPAWHVPKDIKQHVYEVTGRMLPDVFDGDDPENPLGEYAMYLGVNGYIIHGTIQPWSIGKYISSGCIRMNNDDVEELYQVVKVGTPVHIIHYANKAGWENGKLYLESQMPVDLGTAPSNLNQRSLEAVISSAVKSKPAMVNESQAQYVEATHIGVPEPIGNVYNAKNVASLGN